MLSAGLEPTIPAIERPQTHALDRAATGTGRWSIYTPKYKYLSGTFATKTDIFI